MAYSDWDKELGSEQLYMVVYNQYIGGIMVEHHKFDQTWDEVMAIFKLRVPEQEKEFVVVDMEDVPKYLEMMK